MEPSPTKKKIVNCGRLYSNSNYVQHAILFLVQYIYIFLFSFFQVDAVVFTEDLKRLYVTMKEGFPLEYIVSPVSYICSECGFSPLVELLLTY